MQDASRQFTPPSPSAGSVLGGLAAAATTGALLAFGHRLGDAGLPFGAIGGLVFHSAATAGAGAQMLAGLLLNAAAAYVWSLVFALLVRDAGWRDWLAALAVSVAQLALSWLVAASTGNGIATVLPLGDRLVFAAVLGGVLVLGMRFAFPRSRIL